MEPYRNLLTIVRKGIGHPTGIPSEAVDWNKLKAFAERHGLSAVMLDGLNEVRSKRSDVRCSSLQEKILLAEWIGEVHLFYEQRHEQYLQAISDLAKFYNSHGFKMMVLKGFACSHDWPKPEHRPCGDIDIWLFGKQKEADTALETWFKSLSGSTCSPSAQEFKVDSSHHHHTVFNWQGFMVENHYDFINVHHHKSHMGLEQIFKKLGENDTHHVELNGEKVYLPSPNLHALFLIRHALNHFASIGINLRQVLDWALFVEKHGKEVDWDWLLGLVEKYNMKEFFDCINAICVDNLGFNSSLFPKVQFNPFIKERVLKEIFDYVYQDDNTKNILKRQINRFRRWKANEWKHELCYKDSMWSAFWSGVWGHLLKPKTI